MRLIAYEGHKDSFRAPEEGDDGERHEKSPPVTTAPDR
jgi:hypothetical protein